MTEQKEILESIRDIIAGKTSESMNDAEILELTQMVNPDGSVTQISPKREEPTLSAINPTESIQMPENSDNDILSEIDQMLADDKSSIPDLDEKVELEFAPKTEKFEINEEFKSEAKQLATDPNGFEPPIVPRDEGRKSMNTIISEASANEARSAISQLTNRLRKDGREAHITEPSAPFRSGATVEDLVIEMLKPMMKDWLDNNLPKLVNEIVQKEIQKLIPKD